MNWATYISKIQRASYAFCQALRGRTASNNSSAVSVALSGLSQWAIDLHIRSNFELW